MIDGHRFANMIDAQGRPYCTFAIIGREGEALTVQPAGIDGAVIPGSVPRAISRSAPLRLYVDHRTAFAARGLTLYATPRNTD